MKTPDDLNINSASQPIDVPSFICVVYLSTTVDGVLARVANLAGIEITAATERDALAKVVPAFKERVSSALTDEGKVDWIEPPLPIKDDELERLLPIHL